MTDNQDTGCPTLHANSTMPDPNWRTDDELQTYVAVVAMSAAELAAPWGELRQPMTTREAERILSTMTAAQVDLYRSLLAEAVEQRRGGAVKPSRYGRRRGLAE